MKASRVAVIAGTGVSTLAEGMAGVPIVVPTPFGPLRGREFELDGALILLVQRHSEGHTVAPAQINDRAIATGLSQLKVEVVIATAAVGSLRDDWPAGTMALSTDFIDASPRALTLFTSSVAHTDMGSFLSKASLKLVKDIALKHGVALEEATYAMTNGPRYETPAEVRTLRQAGADIVGMTGTSEATLLREAGIEYISLAVVTNLAAGITKERLEHGDVSAAMQENVPRLLPIILETCRQLA